MTTGNRPLRVDLVADMRRRCGLEDPKPEATAEAGEAGPWLISGEEISLITESDRRMGALRHTARQPRYRVDLAADMRQRFDVDEAQPVSGSAEAPRRGLRVDLVADMRRRLAEREWPPAED